jgi:hypothetical protein
MFRIFLLGVICLEPELEPDRALYLAMHTLVESRKIQSSPLGDSSHQNFHYMTYLTRVERTRVSCLKILLLCV